MSIATIEICNAAGHCKLIEHVKELVRAPVTAVTVGSITILPRDGNPGGTYWYDERTGASLNVLGLPNPGLEYYKKNFREMASIIHGSGKLFRVSVAGFTPAEYATLAKAAVDGGADQIEINAGCPNVWKDGKQKTIPSFQPEHLVNIIECVYRELRSRLRLDVKLSPFSDPELLKKVAHELYVLELILAPIRAVITTNTLPNALAFNTKGVKEISFGEGLAGLGGKHMLHIGLGQVYQFRELLPGGIKVIGVGGISCGKDVRDYQIAGADGGAQVGTHYFQLGAKVFGEILQDYAEKFS